MRPGDIQDESSKDEHQQVLRCGASRAVKRIYSRKYDAVWQRIRRRGSLTLSRRRQLDNMVSTLLNYTAWMEEALVAAEESQLLAPEYIKNLVAVKDNMVRVAAATKRYNENNKEEGTIKVKQHAMAQMDDAAKQFTHLRKILDMARG